MRKKKNNQARTFQINIDVLARLDKYSEQSLYTKSAIVEKALQKYLDEQESLNKDAVPTVNA